MKILFTKDSHGTGEIQDIIGFSDADIPVAKVWPYLRTATREIIDIIGKDNYNICVDYFENQNLETEIQDEKDLPLDDLEIDNLENLEIIEGPNSELSIEEKEELFDLVRYAVALNAFRKHAPLSDVSFTNEGRTFRRDEHEVSAFEWQIDKSDDAMERSYYEAVDELITFIMDSEELESSDYMTQFSGLYVPNLKTFQKFININNSHLLYFKLAPSLRLCEQREIINRLGDKFSEYKLPINKDSYITNLIQNCCVYFAMADGIQKFSVQLFPEGLMKAEKTNKKIASGYDKESTTNFYKKELESLFSNLEIEIKKLQPVYTSKPQINFSKDDGYVSF